jgi:hypothetical protein
MFLIVKNNYFFKPLKLNGNYMYQLLWQSVSLQFVLMGSVWSLV